jgi:hypothetical protein
MLSLLVVSQAKAQVNTFGFVRVSNVLSAAEVSVNLPLRAGSTGRCAGDLLRALRVLA